MIAAPSSNMSGALVVSVAGTLKHDKITTMWLRASMCCSDIVLGLKGLKNVEGDDCAAPNYYVKLRLNNQEVMVCATY